MAKSKCCYGGAQQLASCHCILGCEWQLTQAPVIVYISTTAKVLKMKRNHLELLYITSQLGASNACNKVLSLFQQLCLMPVKFMPVKLLIRSTLQCMVKERQQLIRYQCFIIIDIITLLLCPVPQIVIWC